MKSRQRKALYAVLTCALVCHSATGCGAESDTTVRDQAGAVGASDSGDRSDNDSDGDCLTPEQAQLATMHRKIDAIRPELEAAWTETWTTEAITQLHFLVDPTVHGATTRLPTHEQCFAVGFHVLELAPWPGATQRAPYQFAGEHVSGCDLDTSAPNTIDGATNRPVACAEAITQALAVADRRARAAVDSSQADEVAWLRGAALAYDGCNNTVVYLTGTR
jgi:hypothetical protein